MIIEAQTDDLTDRVKALGMKAETFEEEKILGHILVAVWHKFMPNEGVDKKKGENDGT